MDSLSVYFLPQTFINNKLTVTSGLVTWTGNGLPSSLSAIVVEKEYMFVYFESIVRPLFIRLSKTSFVIVNILNIQVKNMQELELLVTIPHLDR